MGQCVKGTHLSKPRAVWFALLTGVSLWGRKIQLRYQEIKILLGTKLQPRGKYLSSFPASSNIKSKSPQAYGFQSNAYKSPKEEILYSPPRANPSS